MADFDLKRRALLAAGLLGAALPRRSFSASRRRVIVIGAGAAGLSAALSAAEAGAKVTILEKNPVIGGNTRITGGYFAAVDPARQRKLGIEDSEELFREQMLENGGDKCEPVLVQRLVSGAGPALQWLESYGMRFQDSVIEIYGAHWPRCHKPIMPAGEGYIRALSGGAMNLGVDIFTDVKAERILLKADRVVGVKTTAGSFYADAVVVASGGFGANLSMVASFAPELFGLTTNNTPGATGEMLLAVQKAGAELRGMEEIQCLPGSPPGRTHRVRLHNDVSRFIFVNGQGRRFIREDERRDVLRDAVLALPGRFAYSIVDDAGLKSYNLLMQKEAVWGVETGDSWRGDSVRELAKAMGLPASELERTIREYNDGVRRGEDRFGKSPMELRHTIEKPPFWACYAGMTIHYTCGGIRIDENARVLRPDGTPIWGLWACGEATGGVHGVNRMGANGINDAVVFGRLAGSGAASS